MGGATKARHTSKQEKAPTQWQGKSRPSRITDCSSSELTNVNWYLAYREDFEGFVGGGCDASAQQHHARFCCPAGLGAFITHAIDNAPKKARIAVTQLNRVCTSEIWQQRKHTGTQARNQFKTIEAFIGTRHEPELRRSDRIQESDVFPLKFAG